MNTTKTEMENVKATSAWARKFSRAERDFFTEIGITAPPKDRDVEKLEWSMGNWLYIHKTVTLLEPKPSSIKIIATMIYIELNKEEPRAHIVLRLLGRLQNLRRRYEYELLCKVLPEVEETQVH
jgi:hypothetical protein